MDNYITPIKTYTDKDGTWFIYFDKKEIQKLFNNFNLNKKDDG